MNREALLAALKPQIKSVEVEGMGTVHIRQMNVPEIMELRELIQGNKSDVDIATEQIVRSVCDETGNAILATEDAVTLRNSFYQKFEKLVEAIQNANKLGEQTTKNSESGPTSGST